MISRLDSALAALSEGACPEHLTPLRVSGWCPLCGIWWSADQGSRTVTASYPGPVTRPPELPG